MTTRDNHLPQRHRRYPHTASVSSDKEDGGAVQNAVQSRDPLEFQRTKAQDAFCEQSYKRKYLDAQNVDRRSLC